MRFALLLVLAALPAIAAAPGFRSSAPISFSAEGTLHRVALPFEAYRDARPDLADVRVVNSANEEVPIAWAGEPDAAREAPVTHELPVFPITGKVVEDNSVGTEISIKAADGTLVAIKQKGVAAKTPSAARTNAYILDASQLDRPIRALVFDWKAEPGTQVVTLRVASSDDLRSWSPAASGPVVRIEAEGRALVQPRLEIPPRKAKYWRIRWDGNEFALAHVRAEEEPAVRIAPRAVRTATGTQGAQPEEIVFDLGARVPVDRVRIVPADTNAVLAVTLHARDDEKQPWRAVTAASFYRLQREGGEVQSQPVDVGRLSARYWMAKRAAGSTAGAMPTLEAHWRPAELVFVKRGEPPFTLAFGKPDARSATLPLSSLVPDYKRQAELELPAASVAKVETGPPPTRFEQIVAQANPRRIALWAILLAGVGLLGYMAWRLSKQM
ncbi:MAG TPA: DUF3999 domain-containing protein [Usitatibacter sp.]|nr:DUF3999 domain-containing protein [Usitatibacter sp.]